MPATTSHMAVLLASSSSRPFIAHRPFKSGAYSSSFPPSRFLFRVSLRNSTHFPTCRRHRMESKSCCSYAPGESVVGFLSFGNSRRKHVMVLPGGCTVKISGLFIVFICSLRFGRRRFGCFHSPVISWPNDIIYT